VTQASGYLFSFSFSSVLGFELGHLLARQLLYHLNHVPSPMVTLKQASGSISLGEEKVSQERENIPKRV
jgi:hypothetical protein